MKYGKRFMLALLFIPLLVGTTPAAEVTVTIQGTGNGDVYSENKIDCGVGREECTATYPDETILHLEAYPDE